MNKSEIILNRGFFDANLKAIVSRKKTEKGRLRALNTIHAIRQLYPDSETVFKKVCEIMFRKAGGKCSCGVPIHFHFHRIRSKGKDTYKYKCRACRKVFSPLAKTPFKQCHVPLNELVELAYQLFQSKHGVTATEVQRDSGRRYETAWGQLMRIRVWMGMATGTFKFNDTVVEVDETFPKVPTGLGREFSFSRGLGSERIQPVLTIVEQGPYGKARGYVIDEVNKSTIKPIFNSDVSTTTAVYSDGKRVYNFLPKEGYVHLECNHNKKQWSNEGAHVNTAESLNGLIKTQLMRVHKGVSKSYLQDYINELCFKFSYRNNDAFTAVNALFEALPSLHDDVIIDSKFFKN